MNYNNDDFNDEPEIVTKAKEALKIPYVKTGVIIVGTIAACYLLIFIMNLSTKMVLSYKGFQGAVNA